MLPATTMTFSMVTSTLQPIYSSTITALPVVTDNATAITLSSTASSLTISTPSKLRWSRIQNHRIEGDTDTLDKSATDSKDEHFEVLTYEQDDIVHLSKREIINHQPTIKLLRLRSDDIKAAQQKTSDSDNMISSSTDKTPPAKKCPCFRPRRKPSLARIKAQQLIKDRNAKIKANIIKPNTPCDDRPLSSMCEDTVPQQNDSTDSDMTIVYTPPATPKPAMKCK